jgi:hypothetical protein
MISFKFVGNQSQTFCINLSIGHYLINDKVSLSHQVLECDELIKINLIMLQSFFVASISKMLHVWLHFGEWKIDNETHCEIVSADTLVGINIKLVELIMPHKLLDRVFESNKIIFCELGLSTKYVFGHNLIGWNKLIVCTLKHFQLLSEITLFPLFG